MGLVDESRWRHFCERRRRLDKEEARLKTLRMKTLSIPAKAGQSVAEWLRMPESSYARLGVAAPLVEMSDIAEIEARHKYAGYIANQKKEVLRQNKRKQCKYRKILTLTPSAVYPPRSEIYCAAITRQYQDRQTASAASPGGVGDCRGSY